SRKSRYDSVIITRQHFTIFASWIDKKGGLCYSFNLLYRANRDGNTASAFHAKCDNKGATIVIVKIQNSEQIVGGYNPLDWNGSGYKSTKDSFIFSFINKNNLQTANMGYVNEANNMHAVYCHQNYEPTFGVGHSLNIN